VNINKILLFYNKETVRIVNNLLVRTALTVMAILFHDFVTELSTINIIIPILTDIDTINFSENYQVFSLGTVLRKIADLIIIGRYGEFSCNQFEFKSDSSTSLCTMLIKEAVS
jgi:hypothetical protein